MKQSIKNTLSILLKIIIAGILLQTLYYKFTGQIESKYIFSKLGAEPYARWFTAIMELIASILLFIPSLQFIAVGLVVGLMLGAVLGHVFIIGIVVEGVYEGNMIPSDGGLLFMLSIIVIVSSFLLIILNCKDFTDFLKKLPLIKMLMN